MNAKAKKGIHNEDIKSAIRWLKGKGIVNKSQDIVDKTEYAKSTVSSYTSGKIKASPEFRKKFEEVFELSLANFNIGIPRSDNPKSVMGESIVPYVSPINIKNASGEKIEVFAEGPNEIKLLNLFLEERERVISQIEKENEKLTRILESGLIEIKSNLKEALEDLNAIENGQRAHHTVMFHSLERLEKKAPGTLEKELNTLEDALTNQKTDRSAKGQI